MLQKNLSQRFFALLIIGLMVFILTKEEPPFFDVVIQAGHEGRTKGNTGAEGKKYREQEWTVIVANEVAKVLEKWNIKVKRMPAKISFVKTKIAIAIHFDGSVKPCRSGASIGYPNKNSFDFAQRWKKRYKKYYPFRWHKDKFTKNLKHYYGYRRLNAHKFLLLELGEITCSRQTSWLKPRLKKIAYLIALSVAKELKPDFNPKNGFLAQD